MTTNNQNDSRLNYMAIEALIVFAFFVAMMSFI